MKRTQLIALRKERGVTQQEMAAAVGISITSVCRIEMGVQEPGAEILLKWAEALGHDVAPLRALFAGTSDQVAA